LHDALKIQHLACPDIRRLYPCTLCICYMCFVCVC